MQRRLYCIARGRDRKWEAFCPDFDLAVQGQSYDDVRSLLHEAIQNYVHEAIEQPEPARTALLNRRSPFRTRLMWLWRLALAALGSKRQTGESTYGFPVQCPA
jgi:predicted RNase H-like HicB family nuclease